MKKIYVGLFLAISFILIFFCVIQPVYSTINFPDNMYVTIDDIKCANSESNYSPVFKFSLPDNLEVGGEEVSQTFMKIKLFGWLPIKKVRVKLLNEVEVFVGGNTLGFCLSSEGVVVVGSNPVYTASGNEEPVKNVQLQNGDVIKKINDIDIINIDDIDHILNDGEKKEFVNLEIERNNNILNVQIKPALDLFTKKYRLGLWVKNNASGVGTLTYIKKKDNRFGAVGHSINSNENGDAFKVASGEVYLCQYLGIKKGTKEEPGEIKATMKMLDKPIGLADTNCDYGVYGNITSNEELDMSRSSNLGGRMSVKMGKAHIYCDVDGEGVKPYEIKIIKINHQNKANEKSIMFSVVDENLLDKTGGIVQGMSGSPIVQNGKLVGAVTHVFLNDPSKAFGVFVDWMIDN